MKAPKLHSMKLVWIAAILTSGEFVAGVYLLAHDGHILALYLAVTYFTREISSAKGEHYHTVVIDLIKGSWTHFTTKGKKDE